jgi:hypothetical protein
MTVALSIAQQKVSTAAVEFARELASQSARFAAEVERLHGEHPDGNGAAADGAGAGEAA